MFSWLCLCKEQIVSTFRFWANTRNVCLSLCRYQTLPLWKLVARLCRVISWRNGDCTKIAIRHGLKEARTMTLLAVLIFSKPSEVKCSVDYYCVIMSPPCIAVRCLKQLHDTWQAAMDVGCLSQHKPQVALEPNDTRHTSSVRTRGHHICGSSRKTLDARLFIAPMHPRPSWWRDHTTQKSTAFVAISWTIVATKISMLNAQPA